ncbi:hypothetical protein Bbelb_120600 [Branchiostoma belcheri]|nr:hypothetical protein Bbelb_120600 [Branchiostoma belcheri]
MGEGTAISLPDRCPARLPHHPVLPHPASRPDLTMTAQVIPVEAILGKPDFKYQKVQYRRHVWQPGFGEPEEQDPPAFQAHAGTSSASSMYIRSKDYGFQRNVWTPGDVQYRDSELGSQWKAPEGYEGVYDASVWGIPTDGDMLPVPGPPMSRLDYDRMLGLGGQKELGGPLGGEYVTPTEEDRPVDMQAQARPGGGAMPDGTDTLAGDSAARKGHELNRRKLGIVTRPSTMHDRTYGKTAESGKGAELYQKRQRRVVQFSKEDIRSFKPWLSLIYVPPTEILPYYGKPFKFSKEDIRSFKPWLSLIYVPPTEILPYYGKPFKKEDIHSFKPWLSLIYVPPTEILPYYGKPFKEDICSFKPWLSLIYVPPTEILPYYGKPFKFSKEDIRSFKPWLSLIYVPPTEILPYYGKPFKLSIECVVKWYSVLSPAILPLDQEVGSSNPGCCRTPDMHTYGKEAGQKVIPRAPMTPWTAAMQTSGDVEPAFTHLRKRGAPFATYLEKGMVGDQPETVGAVQAVPAAVGEERAAAVVRLRETEAAVWETARFFAVRHIDAEADVWRPDPRVVKAILQERSELHLPPELAGLPESEEL